MTDQVAGVETQQDCICKYSYKTKYEKKQDAHALTITQQECQEQTVTENITTVQDTQAISLTLLAQKLVSCINQSILIIN